MSLSFHLAGDGPNGMFINNRDIHYMKEIDAGGHLIKLLPELKVTTANSSSGYKFTGSGTILAQHWDRHWQSFNPETGYLPTIYLVNWG